MLYILSNLKRNENQWTQGIVDTVKKEFARRRIDFTEVSDVTGTIKKCAATSGVILIPTPVTSLVMPVIDECNAEGVQVILPNAFLNIGERQRFHCVRGDFFVAVTKVLKGFYSAGKRDIAIYGTNTNAQDDILITDAFISQNNKVANSVFNNDGSINECFDSFYKNRKSFNAVICVNDYVAIALIEKLSRLDPGYLEDILIVSFSNTLLSRFYNKPFTSLAPDLEAVGCAVGDIYKIARRTDGHYYRAITIYVDYKFHERGNAKGYFLESGDALHEGKSVFFPVVNSFDAAKAYDIDPGIARLPKIELFLNRLTEQQLTILMMFLRGGNNVSIGEELFLSNETVRYHLKRMETLLGCGGREELRTKMHDVINPQHIEDYLKGNE